MRGQEEEARRAGSTSRQRSSGDELLEDSEEEEEVQVIGHVNGASGMVDPSAISDGGEKSAPHRKAQEEEDPEGHKGRPV